MKGLCPLMENLIGLKYNLLRDDYVVEDCRKKGRENKSPNDAKTSLVSVTIS